MSVIIALKYDKGVLLGSDNQCTYNGHLKADNIQKIHLSKYSKSAIGSVGDLRISNLICNIDDLMDYKDILDKTELNQRYVVNNIINKLINLFDRSGCLYRENNRIRVDNEFLITSDSKIFMVAFDFSVIEFENYACIGSGNELALGYLDSLKYQPYDTNLNTATQILKTAIQKACNSEIYINDNVDYVWLEQN